MLVRIRQSLLPSVSFKDREREIEKERERKREMRGRGCSEKHKIYCY